MYNAHPMIKVECICESYCHGLQKLFLLTDTVSIPHTLEPQQHATNSSIHVSL